MAFRKSGKGIRLADLAPKLRAEMAHQLKAQKKSLPKALRRKKSELPIVLGPADWSFKISGQILGGKNNIIITRSGKRIPSATWAAWRDKAVAEVRAQLPKDWEAITVPVNVQLDYVAGDRLRRDMPAPIDSVWHVLEKAGVVADDTLLWVARSSRRYCVEEAGVVIKKLNE